MAPPAASPSNDNNDTHTPTPTPTFTHTGVARAMAPPPAASPSNNNNNGAEDAAAAELDRLGSELNTCLLSQYVFTVVGLAVGTGLGVQRRSLLPLVGFGAAGSVGDLFWGLGYACKPRLDAYRAFRNRMQPQRPPLQPLPPLRKGGGAGQ